MKTYTFDQLTESQKQIIAERWCSDVAHFSLENCIVEYVLNCSLADSEAPFSYGDITNNEPYGLIMVNGCEYQLTESERDGKLEFYEYLRDKWYNHYDNLSENLRVSQSRVDLAYTKYKYLEDTVSELESLDCEERAEIYQWFHCSDYACRKLEEAGECTLDGTFWGRQACGQAIYLDYCIQRAAFDYYADYGKDYITQDTIERNRFSLATFWEA
jgi:hypothetical protein